MRFLRYALVACLGIALTVGQAFRLHMHVLPQGKGNQLDFASEHLGSLHIASTLHDSAASDQDAQPQGKTHEHAAEIDISPYSFIKKAEILVLATLLFLITVLLLPRLRIKRIVKHVTNPNKLNTPLLYLLNPPLRAPPSRLSI